MVWGRGMTVFGGKPSSSMQLDLVYNTHQNTPMRTNVEIDDEILRQALALTGVRTKRELVDLALRELVRSRRKRSMRELVGDVEFVEDFDHKAMRDTRGTD